MLLPFDKVAFEHTSIEANELTVPLRLSILEAANVAATINIGFNTCSMFKPVAKQAFVDISDVRFEDAVPKRLVV